MAHHSLTFGFALMRCISPSKSSPTYLNVAKRVLSLSKKIESAASMHQLVLIYPQASSRGLRRKLAVATCIGQWELTIHNVAILDLLQDFGPDVRVALLVCGHGAGLEMDDLRDAFGGHFGCGYGSASVSSIGDDGRTASGDPDEGKTADC